MPLHGMLSSLWHFVRRVLRDHDSAEAQLASRCSLRRPRLLLPPLHEPGPGSGSGFRSTRPPGPQERSHAGGRRFRTEAPCGHVGWRSRDPACRRGRPGSRKSRRLLRETFRDWFLPASVPPGLLPYVGAAQGRSDLHVSFACICIWPTNVTLPSLCQGRPQ